jgi:hypothetical protein
MRWKEEASKYAARWVLNHWCSVLILDPFPFRPDAAMHEEELASLIADPDWGDGSGSSLESIEQIGLVAPRLQLPGYEFPLLAGLRALETAPSIEAYVWNHIFQNLQDEQVDELYAIGEETRKWLEERLPDLSSITSRALWGGLLLKRFHVIETDKGVMVRPNASAVLSVLESSADKIGRRSSVVLELAAEVPHEDRPELIHALEAYLAEKSSGWTTVALVNRILGRIYRVRSGEKPAEERAADLALALAAYTQAWQAVPPDHPDGLDFAIDVANTLRDLPERSAEQRELLITAQTEIRDRRRDLEDPSWPTSANLLGDAYRERAESREDRAAREQDLGLALAAYTEAWQAGPPEDRVDFAIDVANTLRDLPERSAEQGELLITAQTEIRDRRRDAGDPSWLTSANLVGDAYRERAQSREDGTAREQDLALALAAYTQAWQAAPADHEQRLTFAIDVANTLLDLPGRSAEQGELLITAQTEIRDRRRGAEDPSWPQAANLLGRAYRERAESREDGAAREQDLALALAAYTQAWQAAPPDHEGRVEFAIGVANTLRDLAERSAEQRELLITAQTEIRDRMHSAGDPEWLRVENLLGDAYRERAESREDGAAREQDLALALAAYIHAWQTVTPDHRDRLDFAIDVANALRDLPERSAEQWELLITAQTEIRDRRRAAEDPNWPTSANLLGDAYWERAESQEDGAAREQDLTLALATYAQAWQAVPPDHEQGLTLAIGVANTLLRLPGRSAEQRELLITAQTEIRDRRRDAEDPNWPQAANLLGEAYRERAESREDGAAREQDLDLALAAYTQAWEAAPPDHELRLTYAIGVANTLLRLPGRSAEQWELLITAQTEIRDRRRDAEDPSWPQAANLLGEAYRERAESREDETVGEQDLALALAAYTQAWQAAPPDHEDRVEFAVDVANMLLRLPGRSAEQWELLLTAQTEIRDRRRDAEHPSWPQAANLLGRAYRERAESRGDQAAREQDLALALAAYAQAWQAVPPDHELRLTLAIGVANTLLRLPGHSAEQWELLITAQTEIRDRRRDLEDPNWPQAANLLGRAYRERAENREDGAAREQDLALALAAYTQAWQAGPPEDRVDFAIDVANTLRDTAERSAEQRELLITVQTEIRDRRRDGADPSWPTSANLLGDAYRERAQSREDGGAREQDLALALAAYTQAWQAAPPDHEQRLTFAIDVADTLMDLPGRSAEQLELLITAQTEIRDRMHGAGDPEWIRAENLLGDAYRERAESREDGAAREQDLALALAAYIQAWQTAPPYHEQRLTFAIDVANTLRDLAERSAEQWELLITAQTEIRDRRRDAEHPSWPTSANLLGDAYRERAESREDGPARWRDLALALAAYTQAWQAAPPEDRVDFAIGVADTLLRLPGRSAEQWELLLTAGTEIRDRRRDAADPSWPQAANLLGRAYRERAESREDGAAREQDLALALAAYTEAWQAVPPDHELRLTFAIDVANRLLDLPGRSAEQRELLITAQTEIRDRRRDAEHPSWPQAANLLGRAYRERAESRGDQAAREQDLALALAAYTQAWEAAPPDHEQRLTFAIDLANTLVIQAAIRPVGTMDGQVVVRRALDLVSSAMVNRETDDLTELRRLLPVLSARLARQQWL